MSLVVIDYTGLYFGALAKTPVPVRTSGKFVRIRSGSADYVVFSPQEFTKYHADIIERFCMDRGIEGTWDVERKRYVIIDGSWSIRGGGKFEKDGRRKTLRLYDESQAYGRFDELGLSEALGSLPENAGFAVFVE